MNSLWEDVTTFQLRRGTYKCPCNGKEKGGERLEDITRGSHGYGLMGRTALLLAECTELWKGKGATTPTLSRCSRHGQDLPTLKAAITIFT